MHTSHSYRTCNAVGVNLHQKKILGFIFFRVSKSDDCSVWCSSHRMCWLYALTGVTASYYIALISAFRLDYENGMEILAMKLLLYTEGHPSINFILRSISFTSSCFWLYFLPPFFSFFLFESQSIFHATFLRLAVGGIKSRQLVKWIKGRLSETKCYC